MSEEALRRRISKITNTTKMRSFITVLEAEGKEELAQEARSALQRLLTSS